MILQDVPLSAYALCYGPLALTIIGFIAFAVITDADARRTYLRDMDKRGDDELTPEDVLAKRERTRGRTIQAQVPAGDTVLITPDEGDAEKKEVAGAPSGKPAAAVAEAPPVVEKPPAEEAPPETKAEDTPPSAAAAGPDDLTRLEGIGPKTSQALIAQGIDTFAKLASQSLDDLRAAMSAQGLSFVPSAESWAEQASYAARGDWDGLKALQSRLVSGRYPPEERDN